MKVDFHEDPNSGHSEQVMENFEKETSSCIWGLFVHFQCFRGKSLQELANNSLSQQTYLSFQETYQHIFYLSGKFRIK